MECNRLDIGWVAFSILKVIESDPHIDVPSSAPFTWLPSLETVSCGEDVSTCYEDAPTEVLYILPAVFVDEGDHEGKLSGFCLLTSKDKGLRAFQTA